jgi:2-polyprenyl-3-methyl-5-hydroxy-6-metoxy-1,4-benzoquinol methylase
MTANIVDNCLLGCKAGVRPLAANGNGRYYDRCKNCGLAFVREQPNSSALERLYFGDINSPTSYYDKTIDTDAVTFRKRLRWIGRFQPNRGLLLDIGCSVGTLMRVAASMGWEVEGIEPNPHAARIARGQGFHIHESFFGGALTPKPRGNYQCVSMSDVIEHIPNPLETIRQAKKLMAKDGLLFLSTPNLDSFWSKNFQLKPVEHLFLFNTKNLQMMLAKEGLEVCCLKKTSRRRNIENMSHSTTEIGPKTLYLVNRLSRFRITGMLAWMMEHSFRDDLVVIARKSGEQ